MSRIVPIPFGQSNGRHFLFEFDCSRTIGDLKRALAEEFSVANPNHIRLVFGQSVLEDSQVVFEAGILDETAVRIVCSGNRVLCPNPGTWVQRVRPGSSAASSSASPSGSGDGATAFRPVAEPRATEPAARGLGPGPTAPSFAPVSSAPTFPSTGPPPPAFPPATAPSFAPVTSAPMSSVPSFAPVSSAPAFPPATVPSFAPVSSAPVSSVPSFAPVSSAPAFPPATAPSFAPVASAPVSSAPTFPSTGPPPPAFPPTTVPSFAPVSSAPVSSVPSFAPVSSAPAFPPSTVPSFPVPPATVPGTAPAFPGASTAAPSFPGGGPPPPSFPTSFAMPPAFPGSSAPPPSFPSGGVPRAPVPMVPLPSGGGGGGFGGGFGGGSLLPPVLPSPTSSSSAHPSTPASFVLAIRTYNRLLSVPVEASETFRVIKDKIARASGIVREIQLLVFRGAPINDDDTPASLGLEQETCIHLVAQDKKLSDPFNAGDIHANCPTCHTAGAKFSLRPCCPHCLSEGVMLEDCELPSTGVWSDLLRLRLTCFACMDRGVVPAGVGFLCDAKTPNARTGELCRCPSTKQDDRYRTFRLRSIYKGDGPDSLKRVLKELFSYAHTNGLEDHIEAAERSAAMAGGAALSGGGGGGGGGAGGAGGGGVVRREV